MSDTSTAVQPATAPPTTTPAAGPEVAVGGIAGVGVDLVHVPSFADQLARPGTRFAEAFTPGERADAHDRPDGPARHLAARWAAKEAVIKAWSATLYGSPPVTGERVHRLIEVVTDAWGRPAIRLHGEVARHLAGHTVHVSLSHDADHATAYVLVTAPGR